MLTEKRIKNGQTNRQNYMIIVNYTNFESNLAMMVIYLPDKQTKNRQTNGLNYTNFKSNLAMMVNYTNFEGNLSMMMIYLPVKFEFDWTKRFRVRVRKLKC